MTSFTLFAFVSAVALTGRAIVYQTREDFVLALITIGCTAFNLYLDRKERNVEDAS